MFKATANEVGGGFAVVETILHPVATTQPALRRSIRRTYESRKVRARLPDHHLSLRNRSAAGGTHRRGSVLAGTVHYGQR